MFKSKSIAIGIALTAGLLFATGHSAVAQGKKMTYATAFAKCKEEIRANVPGADTTSSADRYAAGSACMHKYGFRLKKKAKI